jgi:hypothetical protein
MTTPFWVACTVGAWLAISVCVLLVALGPPA